MFPASTSSLPFPQNENYHNINDDDGDGYDEDDFDGVFPGWNCSQLFPGGPQHRGQVQAVRSKVDEGNDVMMMVMMLLKMMMVMMM